ALKEAVGFQLPDVVSKLRAGVRLGREVERLKNGGVEVSGPPASQVGAVVEEDFHEPEQPGVVQLDAGGTCRPAGERQRQALKERAVDMHVEACRMRGGQSVGHVDECAAERGQLIETLSRTEVL